MTHLLKLTKQWIYILHSSILWVLIIALTVLSRGEAQEKQASSINDTPTVKVNSLFDLVRFLCVTVNVIEGVCFITAFILICHSLLKKCDFFIPVLNIKLGKLKQLIIGCVLIAVGFTVPNLVNYLFNGL